METHFLDHRLCSFTYYNRLTTDKHSYVSFPTSTGFSQSLTNNGDLQNRGIEVEIGADIIKTKDWTWNASMNFAYNKNTIKKLPLTIWKETGRMRYKYIPGKLCRMVVMRKVWVGGYQEGYETSQPSFI